MTARSVGLSIASLGLLAALPCSPPRNLRDVTQTVETGADLAAKAARLAEARSQCEKLDDNPVPYQEEVAVGATTAVNFIKQGNGGLLLPYKDADRKALEDQKAVVFEEESPGYKLAAYVTKVGKNLALQSGRPEIKWTFGVINNDGQVNAFSTPGGYVLVTSGAVKAAQNEDQLAGILAHEIGHIVKKHALTYYGAEKVEGCKAVATLKSDAAMDVKEAAMAFIPSFYRSKIDSLAATYQRLDRTADSLNFDDQTNYDLVQMLGEKAAAKIVEAGYSQDMELEADQVAADLLMSAGYSVGEYGTLIGTMAGSSTHPGGAERQQKLTAYVQERMKPDNNPFAGPDKKKKPIPLAATK